MDLMYPAEIDRYRLIQRLVRHERKIVLRISEKDVAQKAGVSQAVVSNLETIADNINLQKRHVSREQMIRILAWGLQLPQETIDPIVWLFNGKPLNGDELRWVQSYQPHAQPTTAQEADLRNQVLTLLEKSLPGGNGYSANVKIFFSDPASTLQGGRELLRMEKLPGQRLVIRRYPTFLAMPRSLLSNDEVVSRGVANPSKEWLGINREIEISRHENFMEKVDTYGDRGIFSKAGLREYVSTGAYWERVKHVWGMIDLLKNHQRFEVGLVEEVSEMELEIKSTCEAMVGGRQGIGIPIRGPRWLHFSDESTVLACFLDFERQWEEIPEEDRTPKTVIRQLEEILECGNNY